MDTNNQSEMHSTYQAVAYNASQPKHTVHEADRGHNFGLYDLLTSQNFDHQ